MPIQVTCPACNSTLRVPDSMAGKKGKCKCGELISVPAATRSSVASKSDSKSQIPSGNRATLQQPGNANQPSKNGDSAEKLTVKCGQCGKEIKVPLSMAGKRGKCGCGGVIAVPRIAKGSMGGMNAKALATLGGGQLADSVFDDLKEQDFERTAVNPYAPTKVDTRRDAKILKTFTAEDEEEKKAEKKKAGMMTIYVMAACHILGGLLFIVGSLLLIVAAGMLSEVIDEIPFAKVGISVVAVIVGIAGIFNIATAVGLLIKQSWGWWLAVISCGWAIGERSSGVVDSIANGLDSTEKIQGSAVYGVFVLVWFVFLQTLVSRETQAIFNVSVKPAVGWVVGLGLALAFGGGFTALVLL